MALMFSGGPGVVDALIEFGVKPQYAMGQWIGPWTNQAQIDGHLAYCKQRGVTPAFQFFYWGDEICQEALEGTFSPTEYGGRAESVGEYWRIAKLLADRIKASGIPGVLVSIESEWNKLGPNLPRDRGLRSTLINPGVWDQIFADTAGVFHAAGAKVVTCPGSWHDLALLLAKFPKMVAASDFVATQGLNTLYRQTEASYIAGADKFLRKVEELKVGGKGKPIMIMDTAWSSYSGSYADGKPYAPIAPATAENNLRAGEAAQAKALTRLRDLLPRLEAAGLKGIFYRGLKDSKMNVANYWGYFEWGWGVVRFDGTRKPSYDILMSMAKPGTPPPPPPPPPAEPKTRTEAEYQAQVDRAAAAESKAQGLAQELAKEQQASLVLQQTAVELAGRVEKAQAALRGDP